MKKLLPLLILLCLILCACAEEPHVSSLPTDTGKHTKIAYIPLDDRPNNTECMEYLAQSLGYELVMPEEGLYATKLNGQPKNPNGSTCGDRAALYEWLVMQEEAGCDRYILFADQLLSGGLVSSRSMSESESIVLSDETVLTEYELIAAIFELLGGEDNQVYILDTIMRLAPTVGYENWTKADYTAVRAWASIPRAECKDRLKSIVAGYPVCVDGSHVLPADYGVDEEKLALYLAARERKLYLTDELFDDIPGHEDVFSILIGIDDSSSENCIQKNEITHFRGRLGERDALLSGVDDMGYKALARLYLDDNGWEGGSIALNYYGGTENKPASDYDYRPLQDIVDAHCAYYQLEPDDSAQLCAFILTKPASEKEAENYLSDFLTELDEALSGNKAVILMDASNGAYGDALREGLLNAKLGKLISYSGTLDLANLTGVALSHGVSRYAFLKSGIDTQYTALGFERCMADVLVKDLCYRTVVRAETAQTVYGMGGNADNFYDPKIDEQAVLDSTVARMNELTQPLLDALTRDDMIVGLKTYKTEPWDDLTLSGYVFPWHRTFELSFDITKTE